MRMGKQDRSYINLHKLQHKQHMRQFRQVQYYYRHHHTAVATTLKPPKATSEKSAVNHVSKP